jgi:putative transposase
VLREYAGHYNRGRPHMSLGPGIPDPPEGLPVEVNEPRHSLPAGCEVVSTPVLNGLHFEYRLRKVA